MRQAVEAQVLTSHCGLGEHGLRQILTDVIEEVRQSLHKDISGADLLYSLLNAPWLQSLLKVYDCLQRFQRDRPTPALNYASGLSLQLLIDIRASPGCSDEAKELYGLLRRPHVQALLSAHDTVAQKDYEPILPPMPEDLPEDEEATRIVCLVKNKQPLTLSSSPYVLSLREEPSSSTLDNLCPELRVWPCGTEQRVGLPSPDPSPRRQRIPSEGKSHWDALRCLTRQTLTRGGASGGRGLEVRRGSYPSAEHPRCRAAGRPFPLARCKPGSRCTMCHSQSPSRCSVCSTNPVWEDRLNRSAPSVCSSILIDDIIKELDSRDNHGGRGDADVPSPPLRICTHPPRPSHHWTMSPPCLTTTYYSTMEDFLPPGVPPKLRSSSPHICTAPPSPMLHRRQAPEVPQGVPVELARQESLDELRSTVQLAASSMESSTKDIKRLGEKMAEATERMSESVQENAQALVLLAQVVERLQTLLTPTWIDAGCPTGMNPPGDGTKPDTAAEGESTQWSSEMSNARSQEKRLTLTHQTHCSFPSPPSSIPSISPSGSVDTQSTSTYTSQGTGCLTVPCHGSPRATMKTKGVSISQHLHPEFQDSKSLLSNGLLEEPGELECGPVGTFENQKKKKRKKSKKMK